MKKVTLFTLLVVSIFAAGILLSGCSNYSDKSTKSDKNTEEKVIKIGAASNTILMAQSGKDALEKMGYKVDFITFDDFFLPNTALAEGSIDANFYQHEAFMDKYNKEKNTNIVMLEPKMYNYFTGFYSKKGTTLADLPNDGKIGFSNDASNIDHNLRLFDRWGIIKLTDEKKDLYTVFDIVDNPKNFTFVQLDYQQRIASLDELTGMICASNTAFMGGLNPTENLLFKDVDSNYALGICVNANKENTQLAKDLITAYTSDDAVAKVSKSYQGAFERVK